jgi:hypothetical protein
MIWKEIDYYRTHKPFEKPQIVSILRTLHKYCNADQKKVLGSGLKPEGNWAGQREDGEIR